MNESFVCSECQGVFPKSRREAHIRYWCSKRTDSDESGVSSTPIEKYALRSSTPAEMTAAWSHNQVEFSLGGVDIDLKFEQQSIFGDISTGGALWHCELVLAEWCAREISQRQHSHTAAPMRVLELGCGVAPAAGLATLAMGCDVLLTDMSNVLPFIEGNIRLNHSAVAAERNLRGFHPLSRMSCDTEELMFGEPIPVRARSMAPFDLILCSDCVYQQRLHEPLARTLLDLLCNVKTDIHSNSRCVVAFFLREPSDADFISKTCPKLGLVATELFELGDLIRDAPWSTESTAAMLVQHIHMYEITNKCR